MNNPLTLDDIGESTRAKVYTQDYAAKPMIEGVHIIELKYAVGEEGDFTEIVRLNEKGESEKFPGFFIRQINRSTQFPGSVKAWHMHLRQDEVWYIPEESHLMAGLWDLRKDSKTYDMKNRIVMGGSTHRLLYIPRGVAHGSANFSNTLGVIIYFVNMYFDKNNPDEQRIPWDTVGADFWKPERD